MKIFKETEDSELFQVHGITAEELIAENDIHKNYGLYLQSLLRMSNQELRKHAPGDPDKVRQALKLQAKTCFSYQHAFNEIISKGGPTDPKQN